MVFLYRTIKYEQLFHRDRLYSIMVYITPRVLKGHLMNNSLHGQLLRILQRSLCSPPSGIEK
jgi:hypothetical protein